MFVNSQSHVSDDQRRAVWEPVVGARAAATMMRVRGWQRALRMAIAGSLGVIVALAFSHTALTPVVIACGLMVVIVWSLALATRRLYRRGMREAARHLGVPEQSRPDLRSMAAFRAWAAKQHATTAGHQP